MAHGGARPNAGRKPKAQELKLADTMDMYCTPDDFWAIVWGLVSKGDVNAIKLWAAYRFGQPKQTIEQNNTGLITIVRSGDNYSPIPSSPGTEEDSSEPQAF